MVSEVYEIFPEGAYLSISGAKAVGGVDVEFVKTGLEETSL